MPSSLYKYTYLCAVASFVSVIADDGPYLQVYPPVNASDDRIQLHFALMLSFGGDYTSIGALPGVQIALDYINNEPSILPGYTLHYTLTDSQCNRSIALESLFKQLTSDPIKLGWIGSGCSVATEPTAEITQYFHIPQVSCVSSSSELKNRERYPYYFQLLASEDEIANGFFKIISNFGWRRVGIITQNENLFTKTMDALKQKLQESGEEFTEKLFKTEDGIGGIGGQIFEPDIRIYIAAMYAVHARDLLCKAYKDGVRYPKYMIITIGWYDTKWWEGPATFSEYNCTAQQRASVLAYTLAPRLQEAYTNLTAKDESGITAADFIRIYQEKVKEKINDEIHLSSIIQDDSEPFYYAQHCHEGMLVFAYALDKTIRELNNSRELNENATQLTNLPQGQSFSIENFLYNNSLIVTEMFRHLQSSSFRGISGNTVQFNDDGTREIDTIIVYQYWWNESNVSELIRGTLGTIKISENKSTFNYSHSFSAASPGVWPDGIPNDGIPIEEVVTVSVALTVVYATLATAGLVFAVVCLTFTFIFRHKKLIRLSSPNLNYIIGLGAIILYFGVITFVIPTTNPDFVAVLCNINPWLTSLGYSLCYGTILFKTVRIWLIFNKPQIPRVTRSLVIKDYMLALFVLCLVVIDIFILGLYTAIEGHRGQLGVRNTTSKENLEDTIGPTCEIHHYYLYICKSEGQVTLFTILFGYKGLLQIIALVLAFSTRKVKVKGLNDSKYIAAAIYVTSIVLAVTMVSTYTLMDYVNVYPAVVGMGFLLGTTMILGLVFVPRMVGLYKDPEGKNVKIMSFTRESSSQQKEFGDPIDTEIKKLRRRVTELERNRQQAVDPQPQVGNRVSVSNPDYLASSLDSHPVGSERYQNHQLHLCASSHDSSRDTPLIEVQPSQRSVVRWSQILSSQSPVKCGITEDSEHTTG